MKMLILAVVLAVMQAPIPRPRQAADKPASARRSPQAETKYGKGVATQTRSVQQPIEPPTTDTDTSKQSNRDAQKTVVVRETISMPVKDWWDRAYVLAAIALVIVGCVGAYLAWRTLKVIEKQTRSTESAAKAALLNAQAVINSERPWVVIFVVESRKGTSFRVGNTGRTPAGIVSFSAEFRCVERLRELPAEPEFKSQKIPQIKLLVPGNTLRDQNIELLSCQEFTDFVDTCRRENGIRQFRAPPKLSVFYFRVLYTHAGGQVIPNTPPYESRACFCFQPADAGDTLSVCGSESYNRYT